MAPRADWPVLHRSRQFARPLCMEEIRTRGTFHNSIRSFPLVTYSVVALLKVQALLFGWPSTMEGAWLNRAIFPALDTATLLPN
ncbi:hypothetical protein B0H12DRAFT_1153636, partial [Mycena haematopus]